MASDPAGQLGHRNTATEGSLASCLLVGELWERIKNSCRDLGWGRTKTTPTGIRARTRIGTVHPGIRVEPRIGIIPPGIWVGGRTKTIPTAIRAGKGPRQPLKGSGLREG